LADSSRRQTLGLVVAVANRTRPVPDTFVSIPVFTSVSTPRLFLGFGFDAFVPCSTGDMEPGTLRSSHSEPTPLA
jgi:hypothetical protein